MGPTELVEGFVTKDTLFNYAIPDTAGIVETWKLGLEICKSRTLEREDSGEAMFHLTDYRTIGYSGKPLGIARLIADICFVRYTYEDLSENPGLNGVASAARDADVTEQIILDKLLCSQRTSPHWTSWKFSGYSPFSSFCTAVK